MYAAHFGFRSEPFSLTPDPAFLYRSSGHSEALAALRIAIEARRGLAVLVGEVGTGKTTVLYSLLHELEGNVKTAYLSNTRLPFVDLLRLAVEISPQRLHREYFSQSCPAADVTWKLEHFDKALIPCDQMAGTIKYTKAFTDVL